MERPDEQCAACKKAKRIERFNPEFRSWLEFMIDLWDRMQAGWQVRNDELTLEEWRALARIGQFYRQREMARALILPGVKK